MNDDDRRFLLRLARKLDDRMIHPDDATDFAGRLINIASTPAVNAAPDSSLEKRAMAELEDIIDVLLGAAEGVRPREYLPFCTYLLVKALESTGPTPTVGCGLGGLDTLLKKTRTP